MYRRTRRAWAVVAVAVAGVLLAACASSGGPATIYGDPPALQEYRDNLGDLEILLDRGSALFPTRAGPSQGEYRGLVDMYHEQGLQGLSNGERESLLLVAQFAFLAHADTLRYSLTTEDATAKTGNPAGGEVILEEVYRQGIVPSVAARRISGKDVAWPWTVEPRRDLGSPAERVEVYEVEVEEGGASEFVQARAWDRRGAGWVCSAVKAGREEWSSAQMAYLALFADYALGDLMGSDAIGGKPAYRFTSERPPRYVAITYWLDAETLWLRQYEYEEDGVRYRVKLEAVNEDIVIEPPDVDVECVEQEPQ